MPVFLNIGGCFEFMLRVIVCWAPLCSPFILRIFKIHKIRSSLWRIANPILNENNREFVPISQAVLYPDEKSRTSQRLKSLHPPSTPTIIPDLICSCSAATPVRLLYETDGCCTLLTHRLSLTLCCGQRSLLHSVRDAHH